jgi:L-threonylcarbamoyladenylate synthase
VVEMKAKILSVDSVNPDVKVIKEVVDVMKKGGLIIYPTETSYGIGTDATNIKSIEKIYGIKGRDPSKSIPVLVSSLSMIKKYGVITKDTEKLVKKFMPGPLSIVVKKKRPVSDANQESISFRISSHPVASKLVESLKKPMTTTSANVSGQPSIYEIKKVVETFGDKVDMIINCGNLPRVEPSTCVDMTREGDVKIVREGPIPSKLILKELKK